MTLWQSEEMKNIEKENIGRKYLKIVQNFYLQRSGLNQNGLQYETNLQTSLPDWKPNL